MPLSELANEQQYFLFGGIVSFVFCCLVIVLYAIFPSGYRKHPSQLIVYKTCCDFVFAVCLILPSLERSWPLYNFGISQYCRALSALTQFSLFASDSWFFLLSVDFLLAIRNPFSCHADYTKWYHLYAWGTSLATAFVLETSQRWGLTMFGFCWIRDIGPKNINWVSWFNAYIPFFFYYSFAIVVLLFARYLFLKNGMPESDEIRKRVLTTGIKNVYIFGFYWVITGACWSAYFVVGEGQRGTYNGLVIWFSIQMALKGVVDFAVWFLGNREIILPALRARCCRRARSAETELLISTDPYSSHHQINHALRRDIMLCTSRGIEVSVQNGTQEIDFIQHEYKRSLDQSSNPFDFKDYVPHLFAAARKLFKLSDESYKSAWVNTLSGGATAEATLDEKFTEGRSGSFFYFCQDNRFIVKTVSLEESRLLRVMMPNYIAHMQAHPSSLLTRFCGLHAIRQSWENKWIHVVVMENCIKTKVAPIYKFDLKGSWVSRRVLKGKSNTLSRGGHPGTLKDLDCPDFRVHRQIKQYIERQGEQDAAFLESMGIMDYSLLVGVVPSDRKSQLISDGGGVSSLPDQHDSIQQEINAQMGIAACVDVVGEVTLFIGIIDILQAYTFSKKVERCFKTKVRCQSAAGLSSIQPSSYQERFVSNVCRRRFILDVVRDTAMHFI